MQNNMIQPLLDPNPVIYDESNMGSISFKQSLDLLMDPEEYSKFIRNIESTFRKSRFYKDYKASIMNNGISYDQQMKNINSEMANIEMHHHLPTLKDACIILTEYLLKTTNQVNTFSVLRLIENLHRMNMFGMIMLTTTNHQVYHSDPSSFISITQLYGNPIGFLNLFHKFFTVDIAYKWLLQFKQEEQYNNLSNWPGMANGRKILLDWSNIL